MASPGKHKGGALRIGVASRVGLVLLALLAAPAMAQQESASPSPSRPGSTLSPNGGIDPSENVKALSEAASKRQDDLRISAKELSDAKLEAANEQAQLRSKFDRDLLKAAVDKLESDAKLRSEFNATIAATEKARVDAIRLVDTGAVAIANERATATANTLAKTVTDTAQALSTQVTRNAEDLRLLVKTTADEQTRSLQQQFAGVQGQLAGVSTRVTALEQAGAEGIGRQKYQDPAMTQLLAEVRTLASRDVNRTGVDAGRGDVIGWIAAVVMLLIALGGLAFNAMRSKQGRR